MSSISRATSRACTSNARIVNLTSSALYRGAVATILNAQSATMALSALLFRRDRRSEAGSLAAAMLAATPQPIDPRRASAHADDRFWPQLVARLRREIVR